MRFRVLIVFAVVVGLALVLAVAVTAQGVEVKGASQAIPEAVSADPAVALTLRQNAASLEYTSAITFTPAFTTRLPAVFRGYAACSTIPTLISPLDGSDLDTLVPLLTWDSGDNPNATTLHLQVAKASDFTRDAWSWSSKYSTIGVNAYRFGRNLDPNTIYFWRAWLDCGETVGAYSDVWSFTTGSGGTILPAPALIAPTDGSTLTALPVTLQWSAVDGAAEYRVRWQQVGQGSSHSRWATGTQTVVSGLETDATYEWWVSARNDYALGDSSVAWQFTTPAESSSIPPQDLKHSFVVEDDGGTTVIEGQDSR
jgi:hypothetical protein